MNNHPLVFKYRSSKISSYFCIGIKWHYETPWNDSSFKKKKKKEKAIFLLQ